MKMTKTYREKVLVHSPTKKNPDRMVEKYQDRVVELSQAETIWKIQQWLDNSISAIRDFMIACALKDSVLAHDTLFGEDSIREWINKEFVDVYYQISFEE